MTGSHGVSALSPQLQVRYRHTADADEERIDVFEVECSARRTEYAFRDNRHKREKGKMNPKEIKVPPECSTPFILGRR